MAARDPETGQFVSGGGSARYSDYEVITMTRNVGIPAADLTGATGFEGGDIGTFEGLEILDYDAVVDRNEQLELLTASHHISVYHNATSTADGTVRGMVEVSSSPSRDAALGLFGQDDIADSNIVDEVGGDDDDSIDLLGRPLLATAEAGFSDGSTGVGGGGAPNSDTVEISGLPPVVARFHPRDELFLNGALEVWNVDDAGVHVDFVAQHIYGVTEQ